MATVVMRKPAELASALRVSLSAAMNSSTWPPLTMPKPALPSSISTVSGDAGAARQIALDQQRSGGAAARARSRGLRRRARRDGPAARAAARPRQWRPPSGQLGASAISAIERGVLHHPLHELVKCCARKSLRVLAQMTSRSCRAGCDLRQKRPPFPRCGRRSGNPQQLTPRQPSATCAASVNLRTSW